MDKLLSELGLKGLNDYESVINISAFEKINIDDIRNVLIEFKMNDKNLVDSEESKFEHINLILMFKYEKIIDSIKVLDNNSNEGFHLEPMP
jgi:hypothetical protein